MARYGENIYKRNDGRWEGRVKISSSSVYTSFYSSSYRECKKKIQSLIYPGSTPIAEEEEAITISDLTFSIVSQQWLQHIRPTVKESTFANYKYILKRYINNVFATKFVQDITKEFVEDFSNRLIKDGVKSNGRGLAVRTVGSVLIVLKAALSFAVTEYNIKTQVKTIKLPKGAFSGERVLSDRSWEKLNLFLIRNKDKTAAAIAISMYTGMRIGEICALKKGDIDFEEQVIHIRQSIQRIRRTDEEADIAASKTKIISTEPKSSRSIRKIPIPSMLIERLRSICKKHKVDEYILSIDSKKPLDPRTLQYRFKTVLENEEINDINFHALRHTFATRCIEKAMDVKTLSEILGHASVTVTLDRYVHSSIEFKRMQMNRLHEVI